MIMLQNVPQVSEGCGAAESDGSYTLVASFPQETNCTGPSGACLVMCKAQVSPILRIQVEVLR